MDIEKLCINTVRTLCIDAIEKAGSGHPGAPMGLAPAAYVLWTKAMKHNPKNPQWPNRDRFVLSAGHASTLLYSLLYLTGYKVDLDDIKDFRQMGSKTPGHPEFGHTDGVETTTGPLGQGFANAVGMAIAERHLAAIYNNIIDHYTYIISGDGDLMEGVCAEAASLAGHLGLGRLICLYDSNGISIEGKTDITFTEDVAMRFKAFGWQTLEIEDGNDTKAILDAIEAAKKELEKPSLIIIKTHIAYGSPNKQDSAKAHGAPLGEEEVRLTKQNLGWPEDKTFFVPEQALAEFRKCIEKGDKLFSEWSLKLESLKKSSPDIAKKFEIAYCGKLPQGWEKNLPSFSDSDKPIATRAASGKILNALSDPITALMGGSADLAPSNNTYMENIGEFQKGAFYGRNIRFGVREHAMAAIMNGMMLHKGVRPYGGTFLVFSDYMRPAIRTACIMKLPVIYIFTHDSIAVGEDGPTHQPVEHLASLRAIPGLTVIRPADASETVQAWKTALNSKTGPTAIILSRQKLPVLNTDAAMLEKGAYIVSNCSTKKPDIILMGSGSEVSLALSAKQILEQKGAAVRVVSMPSWELFEKTSKHYKESVLPPKVEVKIAVEAGLSMGWERYTGQNGTVISIERFGASGPYKDVMNFFGFTAENIAKKSLEQLALFSPKFGDHKYNNGK